MHLIRTSIALAAIAGIVRAQNATPAPRPQFEVASIKASAPTPDHPPFKITDARVDVGFMSIRALIQIAYRVEASQVSGPDWIAITRFDISAKLPEGAVKAQVPEMLQSLLEDRFKLTVHHEPKVEAVYALVPDKGGPKLQNAAPDNQLDAAFLNGRTVLTKTNTFEGDGFWTISSTKMTGQSRPRVFDAPRITMPDFARTLLEYVDRPVVDMTGIEGPYHVTLEVPLPMKIAQIRASADISPDALSDPSGDNSIFQSVRKLGLKLEKRTAPVDHLIVDHVNKSPTDN